MNRTRGPLARRVNLSGRKTHRNALEVADIKRAQRQRNQHALQFVQLCQRLRRGVLGRRAAHDLLRADFDQSRAEDPSGSDPELFERQRIRLGFFVDPAVASDIDRLEWLLQVSQKYCLREEELSETAKRGFVRLHSRLASLATLPKFRRLSRQPGIFDNYTTAAVSLYTAFVNCLNRLTCMLPVTTSPNMDQYYHTLNAILQHVLLHQQLGNRPIELVSALMDAVTAPLSAASTHLKSTPPAPSDPNYTAILNCYSSFALSFLSEVTIGESAVREDWFLAVATTLDCRLLTWALVQRWVQNAVPPDSTSPLSSIWEPPIQLDEKQRLSLLVTTVFFHVHSPLPITKRMASQPEFVQVISSLLVGLVDHPALRVFQMATFEFLPDRPPRAKYSRAQDEHYSFVQAQLKSLVTQQQIRAIFSAPTLAVIPSISNKQSARRDDDNHHDKAANTENQTHSLATQSDDVEVNRLFFCAVGYALALIKCFSKQGDQIRIWTYLAEGSYINQMGSRKTTALIRILSEFTLHTDVVNQIREDPKNVFKSLQLPHDSLLRSKDYPKPDSRSAWARGQDEWRVILLFLEVYSFVVKVVDDDEFRSGRADDEYEDPSVNKRAAVPLSETTSLAAFLRNLGFALYFHASELLLALTVSDSQRVPDVNQKSVRKLLGSTTFIDGLNFEYVRGVVTGLLRTIHERDSRWPFLPTDFWLMNQYFDMEGFIPDVVAEEERRQLEIDDLEDEDEEESNAPLLSWAHRVKHEVRADKIAPRLDIVENLPFLTPFHTRVAIFRQFIEVDRFRVRRPSPIGPGFQSEFRHPRPQRVMTFGVSWRQNRPTARVMRGREFEDAFHQFIGANEDFRQPFLVEFVDKFKIQEAGIDGGGVTKEFLLAAIKQAIENPRGPPLFVETENHLLYPNPTILDEMREEPEVYLDVYELDPIKDHCKTLITNVLLRYELLGLLIGKCLYDGILVNYEFAGFFLLKWALAASNGGSVGESGYRANVNDLRELDVGMYQSLLKIKNYAGDVSDLCLSFVASHDVPNRIRGTTRKTEVPLRPGGEKMDVTNDSRLQYVSYMARHLLQLQQQLQTTAFLRGLGRLILPNWLGMFNRAELQMLVGGASGTGIDLDDLRQNTNYSGVYVIGDDGQEHRTVQMFWKVLSEAPDRVREAVVQFVTSSPRAPLLGFSQLNPRFTIRDSGNDQSRLPSASTCVNLLKLPIYTSEDTLREKLFAAAESGAGFDLS